jgi:hypothetical protein
MLVNPKHMSLGSGHGRTCETSELTDHNSSIRAARKARVAKVGEAVRIEERQSTKAITVRIQLERRGRGRITLARTQDDKRKGGSQKVSHVETHFVKNGSCSVEKCQ